MPNNNDVSFGKYFNLPNPGLRSYFGRVREGNPDEYRTQFYKGKSVQKVLQMWKSHLQSLANEWPTLLEYENDLAKKVGPMSVMKPLTDRLSDIDSYYEDILLPSEPLSKSALDAVVREWSGVSALRPRDERLVVEKMKLSTNSGNPYFTNRKDVLSKTVPLTIDLHTSDVVQNLPRGSWYTAAVLGWRGQEGGPTRDDVKQRVVWMFPFGINVKELSVYQPAIELAQRFNLVPAWVGMDAVDLRITKLFDTKDPQDLIVCTDFSKFDQHFNPKMQDAANYILRSILDSSEASRNWLSNVFPVKYMIPLAYDWNKIRKGKHGMGSGSGGTNFDETIVHRALQYEAAQSQNAVLNPNSQCLGDDGILSYPGITVEDVVRSYSAHGQVMNAEKQSASKHECTYLRRWHHQDYRVDGICVGVYSTCRALGRLMEQERFFDPSMWGPKMVALRQLSILENCKYHPLREEFVDFCMKGDKYRLGIDIPGFLDRLPDLAKEATDVMPDFIGYTRTLDERSSDVGIENWWITKYLKSRA